ncbi:hypothetical protein [Lysinibacillus sp. NPDC093216]
MGWIMTKPKRKKKQKKPFPSDEFRHVKPSGDMSTIKNIGIGNS